MAHLNLTGEGRALHSIPGCLLDTHLPFSRTQPCANKYSYIWRCLGASYLYHPSTGLFVATGQLRQGCQPRFHLCIGQTKNSGVQLLLDSSRGHILVSSLPHTSIATLLRCLLQSQGSRLPLEARPLRNWPATGRAHCNLGNTVQGGDWSKMPADPQMGRPTSRGVWRLPVLPSIHSNAVAILKHDSTQREGKVQRDPGQRALGLGDITDGYNCVLQLGDCTLATWEAPKGLP